MKQPSFTLPLNLFKLDFVELTGRLRTQTESSVFIYLFIYVVLPVAGPLCAGMGGKKKKKMMYLTTKNAGRQLTLFQCAVVG